jgi:uncharacterized membrane protein YwzB
MYKMYVKYKLILCLELGPILSYFVVQILQNSKQKSEIWNTAGPKHFG